MCQDSIPHSFAGREDREWISGIPSALPTQLQRNIGAFLEIVS